MAHRRLNSYSGTGPISVQYPYVRSGFNKLVRGIKYRLTLTIQNTGMNSVSLDSSAVIRGRCTLDTILNNFGHPLRSGQNADYEAMFVAFDRRAVYTDTSIGYLSAGQTVQKSIDIRETFCDGLPGSDEDGILHESQINSLSFRALTAGLVSSDPGISITGWNLDIEADEKSWDDSIYVGTPRYRGYFTPGSSIVQVPNYGLVTRVVVIPDYNGGMTPLVAGNEIRVMRGGREVCSHNSLLSIAQDCQAQLDPDYQLPTVGGIEAYLYGYPVLLHSPGNKLTDIPAGDVTIENQSGQWPSGARIAFECVLPRSVELQSIILGKAAARGHGIGYAAKGQKIVGRSAVIARSETHAGFLPLRSARI